MSSANATAPESSGSVDVTPLVAPILVGHSLNWLGFGALIVQCYVYYDSFPRDRFFIRLLVYGLLVLEAVQTATTTHQTWWYTVTNWGKPSSLVFFPWSAMTVPTIDGLIAFFVQAFYSWRICTLAQSRTMKGAAALIFVMALVSGLVAIITASYFAAHSSRELLDRLHPAFTTWLGTSLAADILVAVAMSWMLYHAKANTIWPESETIITKLINHAIGTGTAVAVCGLITLVLFVTSPEDSLQYLSGAYLLGKLYSNSVLVTLNARRSIRRDIAHGSSTELGDVRPHLNGVSLSFRVPPTTVSEGGVATDVSGLSLSGIEREDAASVKRPEKSLMCYDVASGDVALAELGTKDASMRKGDGQIAFDDPSDTSHR